MSGKGFKEGHISIYICSRKETIEKWQGRKQNKAEMADMGMRGNNQSHRNKAGIKNGRSWDLEPR